jgi:hypothetical protein
MACDEDGADGGNAKEEESTMDDEWPSEEECRDCTLRHKKKNRKAFRGLRFIWVRHGE